ncbi:hypothetical protein N9L19_00490 [bacterium]|nr:hypothetical protein [bacterium]
MHPERIRLEADFVHDISDDDKHIIAVKARAADCGFTIASAHLRPDSAVKPRVQKAFIDPLDQLDPPALVTGDLNRMVSRPQTVPNIEAVFQMNGGVLQGVPERISRHGLQEPCIIGLHWRAGATLNNDLMLTARHGESPADLVNYRNDDPHHPIFAVFKQLIAVVGEQAEINRAIAGNIEPQEANPLPPPDATAPPPPPVAAAPPPPPRQRSRSRGTNAPPRAMNPRLPFADIIQQLRGAFLHVAQNQQQQQQQLMQFMAQQQAHM